MRKRVKSAFRVYFGFRRKYLFRVYLRNPWSRLLTTLHLSGPPGSRLHRRPIVSSAVSRFIIAFKFHMIVPAVYWYMVRIAGGTSWFILHSLVTLSFRASLAWPAIPWVFLLIKGSQVAKIESAFSFLKKTTNFENERDITAYLMLGRFETRALFGVLGKIRSWCKRRRQNACTHYRDAVWRHVYSQSRIKFIPSGVSHSGVSSSRGVSHSGVSWSQFHPKMDFRNM